MYYTDEIELQEVHSDKHTHKAKIHCGLPSEMRASYLHHWLQSYIDLSKAREVYPDLPDFDLSWNWSKKLGGPKNWSDRVGDIIKWPQEILPLMCIECNGVNQGMMMLNTETHTSRVPGNEREGLIYVEYLEAAPWNNRGITNEYYICSQTSLRGVGSALLLEAIKYSRDMGYRGRVGLHALPWCTQFYEIKFTMINMGPDEKKSHLHYYELPTEAAAKLLDNPDQRVNLYCSNEPHDSNHSSK